MERGRGTTIAAILMAGLLLRPTGTQVATRSAAGTASAPNAALNQVSGDGPWKASCKYWQQERPLPDQTAKSNGVAIDETVHDATGAIDLHVAAQKNDAPDCPGASERWGAPPDSNWVPLVRSVIALVPLPVRTHFALQFDRRTDILLEAAADNRYLIRYSWLPWKIDDEKSAAGKSAQAGSGEAAEDEPGLLIFDQRFSRGHFDGNRYVLDDPFYEFNEPSQTEYYGAKPVLYVFLVDESPANGVNARQLELAVQHQSELERAFRNHFSRLDPAGNLDIIGPSFSGSASSLNEGLRAATLADRDPLHKNTGVKIAGVTETRRALEELNDPMAQPKTGRVPGPDTGGGANRYISFLSDRTDDVLAQQLSRNGYWPGRSATLSEDATLLGLSPATRDKSNRPSGFQLLYFPREISLLRNTYQDSGTTGVSGEAASPTPYLHLSTRDPSGGDTITRYSKEISPASQEAQLMSIAHALGQERIQFVHITASNILDELFLAQFLHRSNPDVRIVHQSDLLFERAGDNAPFIGSLSVTPYPLAWPGHSPKNTAMRAFSDSESIGYYNAASYMLWQLQSGGKTDPQQKSSPVLYNYGPRDSSGCAHPSLWLTAVGTDAYYPVAILSDESGLASLPQPARPRLPILVYPSHFWQSLCVLICVICLVHIISLVAARYSSPRTCDLDLRENDQAHRRALYVLCGGVVLYLLAATTGIPLLRFNELLKTSLLNHAIAWTTLAFGVLAAAVAFGKSVSYVHWKRSETGSLFNRSESSVCATLYVCTLTAGAILTVLWCWLCWRQGAGRSLGVFFSYRCIHPDSGVSPLTPVVLLLWGWYLWAVTQTRRLRFSRNTRPRLPDARNLIDVPRTPGLASPDLLFVSDHRLSSELIEDLTCLMISRRLAHKVFSADAATSKRPDIYLILLIVLLAVGWFWIDPVKGLDHFGWWGSRTKPYEFFVSVLLVPLVILTLCAIARLFLVWTALRGQLLEVLEWRPIRFAFSRLDDVSWMAMLRQDDLLKRRRDMARAAESLRQLVNEKEIQHQAPDLLERHADLENAIQESQNHFDVIDKTPKQPPPAGSPTASDLKQKTEALYATCAEIILQKVLIPAWRMRHESVVQSSTGEAASAKTGASETPAKSEVELRAEEFLALRYLALIRAIMVQLRYLMLFITVGFALVMLALNFYPFQPRQEIDLTLTGLLLGFGIGIVMVFAQMHRNTILSRITKTTPNELGIDFYLRIAAFGALPVLTWLATQYPEIWGSVYKLVRPGIDVMK